MNQPNVSLAPKFPLLVTKTVDPIQIYIDQELVPRIEAGRYKAFVRDPELLFFGTGLGMTSGSTKPPITSFPAFVTNEITEMRYLLPYCKQRRVIYCSSNLRDGNRPSSKVVRRAYP
jgi:hypothetical protein